MNDNSNKPESLSSFIWKKIQLAEGADYRESWKRVICPTIQMKYVTIRCNLNNDIYMATWPTRLNYKNDWLFFSYLLPMNNPASETRDPRRVQIDPDWLWEMVRLVEVGQSNIDGIFDFMAWYVLKVHLNEFIRKGLRLTPGMSFLDVIGPNDSVKNSWEMWDQDIRLHQLGLEMADKPPEKNWDHHSQVLRRILFHSVNRPRKK